MGGMEATAATCGARSFCALLTSETPTQGALAFGSLVAFSLRGVCGPVLADSEAEPGSDLLTEAGGDTAADDSLLLERAPA
jgi:hypothetical protein